MVQEVNQDALKARIRRVRQALARLEETLLVIEHLDGNALCDGASGGEGEAARSLRSEPLADQPNTLDPLADVVQMANAHVNIAREMNRRVVIEVQYQDAPLVEARLTTTYVNEAQARAAATAVRALVRNRLDGIAVVD